MFRWIAIGISWYRVRLQIVLPHSAGNSVTVESRNGMPGAMKRTIRLQIVLPHSAGNSVKVESWNGRPSTVKQSNTLDFATSFCL